MCLSVKAKAFLVLVMVFSMASCGMYAPELRKDISLSPAKISKAYNCAMRTASKMGFVPDSGFSQQANVISATKMPASMMTGTTYTMTIFVDSEEDNVNVTIKAFGGPMSFNVSRGEVEGLLGEFDSKFNECIK